MSHLVARWTRPAVLLAINLLFLMIWGFAGGSKLLDGQPAWFAEKFGPTVLGRLPGVTASFWLVAGSELLAMGLALIALLRREFLKEGPAPWLTAALLMSLVVFLQLGFGLWLTKDFNGGFQQFVYFGVTLLALQHVQPSPARG